MNLQGKTLNGNNVIIFNGKNIYFADNGKILGMEDAFFIPQGAFPIPDFVGEYYLNLAKRQIIPDGTRVYHPEHGEGEVHFRTISPQVGRSEVWFSPHRSVSYNDWLPNSELTIL
jgi:hypothetical protein